MGQVFCLFKNSFICFGGFIFPMTLIRATQAGERTEIPTHGMTQPIGLMTEAAVPYSINAQRKQPYLIIWDIWPVAVTLQMQYF